MRKDLRVTNIIFFIILLVGCSRGKSSKDLTDKDLLTLNSFENDSTVRVKAGLELSEDIISEIQETTSWKEQKGYLFIDTVISLNDNSFYILYNISTGVCESKYLMTFTLNTTKDFEELEQNCDTELGTPWYKYSELRGSNNNTFTKVLYVQSPADINTVDTNGRFKKGYSQDNIEMHLDSAKIIFSIRADATITRDTI
ncbi:MAG: hypothetical protein EOO43_16890 [Flavobacterium sp.]|nr:MAG: hypothetical protein EOO43_16890 [Flavobacterium sp.]